MKYNLLVGLAACVLSAPAAQATVTLTAGEGTLVIKGDSASDTVDIDGVPAVGGVRVRINLGAAATFGGIRDVKVKMGAGDDVLNVHGLSLGGNLKVVMGDGDDAFSLDNSLTFGPPLSVFIGGDLQIGMGGQSADFVGFLSTDSNSSIHIGASLRIKGAADVDLDGGGVSADLELVDVTIGGDLIIDSIFSADLDLDGFTVDFDDVNVGGETSLTLGDGPDEVMMGDSHFARAVRVKMGEGDDALYLHRGLDFSQFDDVVIANGQKGDDMVEDDPSNHHANPPVFNGFETVQ